mgnify:CR=1 FL=1
MLLKIKFSNKQILTLGDKITVKLIEVNPDKGIVEFDIVGMTMLKERRDLSSVRRRSTNRNAKDAKVKAKKHVRNKNYRNQRSAKPTRRK